MTTPKSRPAPGPVLCFGEILWDLLPHGAFPGGAPFNVASHLHRLGEPVLMVTAVGADRRGDELLALVRARGLSLETVARIQDLPTGTVTAEIAASGDARYTIATGVAWDRVPVDVVLRGPAQAARALVFGSLALRSADNRQAFDRLDAALPPTALRVFDVNLRAPFDDLALVRRYARRATGLKLNSAEAARLAGDGVDRPGEEERHARTLAAESGAALVCITAGERGAGLLRAGHWTWEPGRKVKVVDTVGAGDAFLAALLHAWLAGDKSDAEWVAAACRRGEWVASQAGAYPAES